LQNTPSTSFSGLTNDFFAIHDSINLGLFAAEWRLQRPICFPALLGSAVTFSFGSKKAVYCNEHLVYACFAFSSRSLCGYLYGVHSLYALQPSSTVCLHTAAVCGSMFGLPLLGLRGILSIAASDRNAWPPSADTISNHYCCALLVGWLRLEDRRANLYDSHARSCLSVLGNIGCLTILTVADCSKNKKKKKK